MPIYAYKCSDCGHTKEVLQKISDAPLTDCPECGQPTMVKMVTAAGFQLKGSGWYVTDFRNKDNGARAGKAAKSDEADKSGKSDGKTDGKSDSAGDAKTDSGSSAASSTASAHACGSGGCASCS